MVFNESAHRIKNRFRSALGRFCPSKSTSGLTTLMKDDLSGLTMIPSVPLPVLTLPEHLSRGFIEPKLFDDILEMTAEKVTKKPESELPKSPVKPKDETCESNTLPVLNKMLEKRGLLNSPISIHLASLLGSSSESYMSSSTTTMIRTPTDSVYSVSLICSSSAGPFTPELVPNFVGTTAPEFKASYMTALESEGYFSQSALTSSPMPDPHVSQFDVEVRSPSIKLRATKALVLSSPNPSASPMKLTASPARLRLRRSGPAPCAQPISSQLLQSVLSTHEAGIKADAKSNGSHNPKRVTCPSIPFPSIEVECALPGEQLNELGSIADVRDRNEVAASQMQTIASSPIMNIKHRSSAPALTQLSRFSFASFRLT